MFASLGRFATRRRRLLLFGWLVLFVVGLVVGGGVFMKLKTPNGSTTAESVPLSTLVR